MSRFSSKWLAVREPFDEAARGGPGPSALVAKLAGHLGKKNGGANILDLGSGTGSNLRHLGPRLAMDQTWTLVDKDGQLLDRVGHTCRKWAKQKGFVVQTEGTHLTLSDGVARLSVRVMRHDLDDLSGLDLAQYDLVTGSALLDLMPKAWLARLTERLAAAGTGVYFALSADGRLQWRPRHRMDRAMAALFSQDLGRDKGLGPTAGIWAAQYLAGLLAEEGYAVSLAQSDWSIGARDLAMVEAMTGFVSDAARMQAGWREAGISAWRQVRQNQKNRGFLGLTVGHQELLALM